ncbi:hypothetical protein BDY21DRAFT_402361, partial [Lineolata rhizophorae]
MASNNTDNPFGLNPITTPLCDTPFLYESKYDEIGGYVPGRFCVRSPIAKDVQCCLPCPIVDWVYPDDFVTQLRIANWISVASFIICVWLLISYAVLPSKKSHRHYLNVGLIISVIVLLLAWIIPLAARPNMCFNDITPRDMHSSHACAWSGTLLLWGFMSTIIWVLLRSIWMHMRVCWDKMLDHRYMWTSIMVGIVIPAAFVTIQLTVGGVSYRTGPTCLANHKNAFIAFWGWLLAFAGLALLLQVVTIAYCLWVFVLARRVLKGRGRRQSRAADWNNVRRLFQSQWRGFTMTVLCTVQCAYFSIVFLRQDIQVADQSAQSGLDAFNWALCLFRTFGDKEACLPYAEKLLVPREVILAGILMVSLLGLEILILLMRSSLLHAWWDLLRCGHDDANDPLTSLEANPPSSRPTGGLQYNKEQRATSPEKMPKHKALLSSITAINFVPWRNHNRPASPPTLPLTSPRQSQAKATAASAESSISTQQAPPAREPRHHATWTTHAAAMSKRLSWPWHHNKSSSSILALSHTHDHPHTPSSSHRPHCRPPKLVSIPLPRRPSAVSPEPPPKSPARMHSALPDVHAERPSG